MANAKRSKYIKFYDKDKLKKINSGSQRLLREYKKDMTLRELSKTTISSYLNDIDQWLIYVLENQDNRCVLELTEDDLTDFLYFCKTQGNNTRRMRRRYATLSSFYKFLRKKRYISENPMEFVDRPIKDTDVVVQTFLTKAQIELMKQKLAECGNLTMEVYALLSLSTMGRVNAIANLRWKQIDYGDRVIYNVVEKEGKVVSLFPSREVCQKLICLQQFRDLNGIDDGGYIFFRKCKDGKIRPIATRTLYSWTKKIGAMIGIPTLHPHDFRHSGSQLLKLAGMSLEDISELLNHESTDTTRKHYLKQDMRSIRDSKARYDF